MKAKPKIKIIVTVEKYRDGKLYETLVKKPLESMPDSPGSTRTSDFKSVVCLPSVSSEEKEEKQWQRSQTPE